MGLRSGHAVRRAPTSPLTEGNHCLAASFHSHPHQILVKTMSAIGEGRARGSRAPGCPRFREEAQCPMDPASPLPGGRDPQSTAPQGNRRRHVRPGAWLGALWVRGPLPGLVPVRRMGWGWGGGRDLNVPRSWCVSCLSATPVTPGLACYSLRTRQMTLARDAALAGEAPGAMPGCTLQPPKAQRSESSA